MANLMTNSDIPPGIDSTLSLQYHASGGNDKSEWAPYPQVRYYTNAFIAYEGKVSIAT